MIKALKKMAALWKLLHIAKDGSLLVNGPLKVKGDITCCSDDE